MEKTVAIDHFWRLADWWAMADLRVVVIALLAPLFVWFLREVFARVVTGLVAHAASKLNIDVSSQVREGAKPAAAAFCVLLTIFASFQLLMLPGLIATWLETVIRLFLVFSVFWLIDSFVQCALVQLSDLGSGTQVIRKTWLPQFVRLLLAILMVVVVLKNWGINLGPALTGLGIAGAAIALAAQDLIRNLIAGVNIAGEKRFAEGDWINFGAGTDGIVEKLQLRSTTIRKFDRSVIHVPNSDLANAPLTNFSSRETRRLRWKIGVPFDTNEDCIQKVCNRITAAIESDPLFQTDETTPHYVTTYSIDTSWITLLVDCFVGANDWGAELYARQRLVAQVREIFAEAGVEFALPRQSVFAEVKFD